MSQLRKRHRSLAWTIVIDGDLFVASKDVKDMKNIKKQLESNDVFNVS